MLTVVRIEALCVDANDPAVLARFWAEALRWEVEVGDDPEVYVAPTDGTPFGLLFLPVPEPKTLQNRIHLDLTTSSIDDFHATINHLVEVGANHIDIGQRPGELHVVLADPEGNEFCVIHPDNRFLAGCGRLGTVNCGNGTREAGYFWSAALEWPLMWDQDEETAIRPPDSAGPIISWGGPPLLPKPPKNRLHLDLAPPADGDQQAEVDRLISLGARRIDIGQGDVSWVVMADPDGNEFCVLTPR